jgi:RNA polymerase sigma factor (sigma-70 family)
VVITRTSTALLEGLKDFSRESTWQEFDRRYRPLLIAVGRRLGLGVIDAEDAAQETLAAFLVRYRQGDYSREKGRLRDWLAGIMTHKVRDVQRGQMRGERGRQAATPELLEQVADASVQQAMEQEWSRTLLRHCLEEVRRETAPQAFESFDLFALQGYSGQEVAAKLGISEDVVYQNKRRILQRLRESMAQWEGQW